MSHITIEGDETPLKRLAYTMGVQEVGFCHLKNLHYFQNWMVFLNGELYFILFKLIFIILLLGNIIGITSRWQYLIDLFRKCRRKGHIDKFVSISAKEFQKCVYICSDGGRLCRPYVIVENGKSLVTQKHLNDLQKGLRTFEDFINDGELMNSNVLYS